MANLGRNLHERPFDDGTLAKLALYRAYLREWLPVFISLGVENINIFDFFAGPGEDTAGQPGSPLITLEEIQYHIEKIHEKNLRIRLYFNELDSTKFQALNSRMHRENSDSAVKIEVDKKDFAEAFKVEYPRMQVASTANLIFLDQTGIKHVSEKLLGQLISLKRTDFLFFISSSTIKRFGEHPNIKQHIKLDPKQIEATPYHKVHRLVLEFYKSLIPENREYHLAAFSLKKNSGLYGLIFGSGHVYGMEKFLITCWKQDTARGEANFDIDDDNLIPGQLNLLTGSEDRAKKIDGFERELMEGIISRKLTTDKAIYLFTLQNGFIPKHARKVIQDLVKDGKVAKQKLNIGHEVCKRGAVVSTISIH